ncbi:MULTISPECIES: hypothetical protein [unclassified Bradyrhizobium]|uniref:hypothetical protein n=1 Tax=unclassified Bradyrhizobium TaxID=2631580 RepID=UPI001FFAE016|nr:MULTISPECIES: hypothetical protein [unclassified Bradyrhizobium]
MAAAVDWLDAYRAGDIETILGMYAEDAVIVIEFGNAKQAAAIDLGHPALKWASRLS